MPRRAHPYIEIPIFTLPATVSLEQGTQGQLWDQVVNATAFGQIHLKKNSACKKDHILGNHKKIYRKGHILGILHYASFKLKLLLKGPSGSEVLGERYQSTRPSSCRHDEICGFFLNIFFLVIMWYVDDEETFYNDIVKFRIWAIKHTLMKYEIFNWAIVQSYIHFWICF